MIWLYKLRTLLFGHQFVSFNFACGREVGRAHRASDGSWFTVYCGVISLDRRDIYRDWRPLFGDEIAAYYESQDARSVYAPWRPIAEFHGVEGTYFVICDGSPFCGYFLRDEWLVCSSDDPVHPTEFMEVPDYPAWRARREVGGES